MQIRGSSTFHNNTVLSVFARSVSVSIWFCWLPGMELRDFGLKAIEYVVKTSQLIVNNHFSERAAGEDAVYVKNDELVSPSIVV